MGCIALGYRAKTKSSQMGCLRVNSNSLRLSRQNQILPRWGASGLNPLGYRAKTKSSLDGVVICGAAKNHTDPNTGHYVNMRLNPVLRAKILLEGGVKKIPKRS